MTLAALINEARANREDWHYTSLDRFAGQSLKPVTGGVVDALPEAAGRYRLVFVNGLYHPEMSILPDLPEGFFARASDGVYQMELSGQTCLAVDPVELLFVDTQACGGSEGETKLRIRLGENSRLTLIERHMVSELEVHARHIHLDIALARQSKLVHGKILAGAGGCLYFAQTTALVQAGAFYDAFALLAGGQLARCDHNVDLAGEMAEARLLAIMLLKDKQHADMTSLVRHLARHTASRQICKGVLNDKSHGVFQGKIHVAKGAQKTDGYQLCRALLLSDKAEMDAKPELEIFADDVKCSHGTAIGDLDVDMLFYLTSRGIPAAEARAMLVNAFIQDLVDQIPAGSLAQAIQEEVGAWLA